jgi:hypothetical protein
VSRSEKILASRAAADGEPSLASLLSAGPTVLDQRPSDGDDLDPRWEGDVPVAPTTTQSEPSEAWTRPIGDFGFQGTFLSEDVVLPGSLQIEEHKVTLWASGAQLASWKIPECKVERTKDDQFSIEADGERITFTADDPAGLSTAIAIFLTPHAPRRIGGAAVKGRRGRTGHNGKAKPAATPTDADPVEAEGIDQPEPPEAEDKADAGSEHSPHSEPSPVIRRPRIKAFAAKSGDGELGEVGPVAAETVEVVRALRSDGGALDDAEETEPGTIADRITANAKRRFRSAKAHRWLKSDLETVAIKAGVVAAAVGILALFVFTVLMLAGGFSDDAPTTSLPTTTTLPPAPTTTVVATTIPPPPSTLFQIRGPELTERWNALAEASRPELTLFTDLSSPFAVSLTPYITFEGVLDPAVGSVVIRATPTGTPEGDGLILTSLGLLIGVSDPTLDGSDRRALLETLGLVVEDPQLGGLDGSVNYNGLTYHLAYVTDLGVIQFTVSPEGAAATTTTTTAP